MISRSVFVYIAAGVAGWWAMPNGSRESISSGRVPVEREADAFASPPRVPGGIRRPVAGSAELSRIAALIAALPAGELTTMRDQVTAWPPGAARAYALAMLNARETSKNGEVDPFGEAETLKFYGESAPNSYRRLAASMAEGDVHGILSYNPNPIPGWVAESPGEASDAILQTPPGPERGLLVDIAAGVIADADPLAALKLVQKSGEDYAGRGTAKAWAKLLLEGPPANAGDDSAVEILKHMTDQQQSSLISAVGETLWAHSYDESNANANSPSRRSDLEFLVDTVLNSAPSDSSIHGFFPGLCYSYPEMADKIRRELESSTFRNPAQQTAFETLYQKQVEEDVSNGLHAEWLLSDDNDGPPPPVDREKLLNDTAPGLIPALARSGRLSDALDMFHRLSDPEIIKDSLEKVLPFWVEADPDGAMAALNAAPLTELERDRLKKLPVFLLHPDKKAPNP